MGSQTNSAAFASDHAHGAWSWSTGAPAWTVGVTGTGVTDYLIISGFGFSFTDPFNNLISISIDVNRKFVPGTSGTDTCADNLLQLCRWNAGAGTIDLVGSNLAAGGNWPSSSADAIYSGSTSGLFESDILDTSTHTAGSGTFVGSAIHGGFGLVLVAAVTSPGGNPNPAGTATVNSVAVTVTYGFVDAVDGGAGSTSFGYGSRRTTFVDPAGEPVFTTYRPHSRRRREIKELKRCFRQQLQKAA